MKPLLVIIRDLLVLLVFLSLPATGNVLSQPNSNALFPLFESADPLKLTITMDIRKVLKDIGENRVQHPAELSYISPEGNSINIPFKIRTRGHFRKDPMNCDFPPLRLNFSDSLTRNTLFAGQDKLKLVAHCRSRGSQYEQNVLKEYLIYKLYELFTEESYMVRLAELSYADSRGKRDTLQKMAFLLEPTDHMAARNNKQLCEFNNVQQDQCNTIAITRLSVFQYMVGNTDWSVPVPHNIDLIQENPGSVPVAVPFDFDWCGLVDAPYAVPAENLGISDVKARVYRGYCVEEEELELVLDDFRDKKEDVFETIETVPNLRDKEKSIVRRYIEQFYSVLDNPKLIQREFIGACRTE